MLLRLARLYTPVISDVLDDLGITSNVLSSQIRPLHPRMKIFGSAITARTVKYDRYQGKEIGEWVKVMLEMLESADKGQIFIVETGNAFGIASWGELMSNSARARGVIGAVTDGAVRDTPKILSMKPPFQLFAPSFSPKDAKGRLEYVAYNIPVTCGGVRVEPGDIVFGDLDGVVIIPKDRSEEVIKTAEMRVRKETAFRKAVRRGERVSSVFRKYRIF